MDAKPESHEFADVMIHQVIETIEFVLGAVSNTASYLSFWALSLAHGQLSEVFFNLAFTLNIMIPNPTFGVQSTFVNAVSALILWPVFWSITFGVIMLMDFVECALHTLRLHWVEFQNKFYKGEGYPFRPYSFDKTLQEALVK